MSKFVIAFMAVAGLVYVLREVLTRKDRRLLTKFSAKLVIPAIVALVALFAAAYLALNPVKVF